MKQTPKKATLQTLDEAETILKPLLRKTWLYTTLREHERRLSHIERKVGVVNK